MAINCWATSALQLIMQKQFIIHNIMADEGTLDCLWLFFLN